LATELARKTAEIANRDVGIRETPPNSNRGERIDEYHSTTHTPLGSPYCAAAISTWILEASVELKIQRAFRGSASALALWSYNIEASILPRELVPGHLPCVGIIDHGGGKGHAYLAVGCDFLTGEIQTIDPNSNPAGSREGGGVYALNIRKLGDNGLKGFIRIE